MTKQCTIDPVFDELNKIDTPTITNAVATYPQSPICLKLYDPWYGSWYTDQRLKCLYPDLGPRSGYAVTVVQGPKDPSRDTLSLFDVLKAVEASPKPVIICLKQEFPDRLKGFAGICGGQMMAAFKAMGVVGYMTDGPTRDVVDVREYGMQYMATGLTAGHGEIGTYAVNVPVEICGMEIQPGEIIHMDANGAVKFPADRVKDVLESSKKFIAGEEVTIKRLLESESLKDIQNAFMGK